MSRSKNPWALVPESLHLLELKLDEMRPTLALECGSGLSTPILQRYAEHAISLEHLSRWYSNTRLLVDRFSGDLRLAELETIRTPAGPQKFYATDLPDGIEFVLIDGPPESVGRIGTLFAIWPHLAENAVIWLDDWQRDGERRAVELWDEHLGIETNSVSEKLLEIRRR